MYFIFWPLIHKFVIAYEKEIFMGELSVGRIVCWANCPLGNFSVSELSVGEYSGHEKKYAQHFNHRLSEIF